MSNVHIYAPQPDTKLALVADCPDCKQRTRMLCFHTPYYGTDSACIKCGRSWSDGEWMDLPFMRGARKKNIDSAKNRFRKPITTEGQ